MHETLVVTDKGSRVWQGIPSIERAANGRLWATFFSGGPTEPHEENVIMLTTSIDDGKTWSDPICACEAPGTTRLFDPCLWHDPSGRLWLLYNRADLTTDEHVIVVKITENSSLAEPVWSEPRDIPLGLSYSFRLNKPTVLSTGRWLMPVTWAREAPDAWFAGPAQLQGLAISDDVGETWTFGSAGIEAPNWALENMFIERCDGSIWMLIRSGGGVLWESISTDGGDTWSPGRPTTIVNPGSRFFIRRLASGRLLFINSPRPNARTAIQAQLSDDDGHSFGPPLILDPREKVSYPDAIQAPDGRIFAVHDIDRYGPAQIMLHVFTESDIPSPE